MNGQEMMWYCDVASWTFYIILRRYITLSLTHQIKTTYCILRSLCILLFFPLVPFWPIVEERPSFASWRPCAVSLWSIMTSKWRGQVKSSLVLLLYLYQSLSGQFPFLCCPSKAVWENCEDVWHLQGTQEKSIFWRVAIRPQYSVSICWGAVWGWTHHRTAEMNVWEVQMLICFHLLQVWLAQKCCQPCGLDSVTSTVLKYWRAFLIWNPQFCCCHSCAMPTSQEFLQGEQLRLSWHLLPPMLLLLSFLFFVFLLVFLWWLWLKLWWCCCWLPCQEIPMMCIYPPFAGNGLENQQLFDSKLFLVYPRKWNTTN